MSGPGPLLTLLATYLYFCTSVGPRYMRDRKPYSLKQPIIIYNITQILMSIFLVYEVSVYEIEPTPLCLQTTICSPRFLRSYKIIAVHFFYPYTHSYNHPQALTLLIFKMIGFALWSVMFIELNPTSLSAMTLRIYYSLVGLCFKIFQSNSK